MTRAHFKLILVLSFLLAVALRAAHGEGQSQADLTTPPPDSAEAERVRIWVPNEGRNWCRIAVNILNDSNQVIRHLIDQRMHRGYSNFYWDKKDDSGQLVPAGEYIYLISGCGQRRYGEVSAEYGKWERAFRLFSPDEPWSTKVEFELLADSGAVSIRIYNQRDRLVDSPVVDSLMNSGRHRFQWLPAKNVPRGVYTLELTVGDFSRTVEIRYRP